MATGNIVMLVIMALVIIVGLAVSLIAITLRNIRESGGQTPQWPVSWPEPPATLPQQQVEPPEEQERASLPQSKMHLPH